MAKIARFEIEVYDKDGYPECWEQGRYLVHGWDDVLWTDSLEAAINFMRDTIIDYEKEVIKYGGADKLMKSIMEYFMNYRENG